MKDLQGREKKVARIFHEDQLRALQRRSPKGMTWSPQTTKAAMQLLISCGSKGYEGLIKLGLPFPSHRTLRRRLQSIPFGSGVLTRIFDYMKIKVII